MTDPDPRSTSLILAARLRELETVEGMLSVLRLHMPRMSADERLALIGRVAEGYCTGCGAADPRCQCQNDE